MVTFLVIEGTLPQIVQLTMLEHRKVTLEAAVKLDELAKRHEVNMIGAWNVHSEHLGVQVFEAPSLEAFLAFSMEPEIVKREYYKTTGSKLATTFKETVELMQRMMQAQ